MPANPKLDHYWETAAYNVGPCVFVPLTPTSGLQLQWLRAIHGMDASLTALAEEGDTAEADASHFAQGMSSFLTTHVPSRHIQALIHELQLTKDEWFSLAFDNSSRQAHKNLLASPICTDTADYSELAKSLIPLALTTAFDVRLVALTMPTPQQTAPEPEMFAKLFLAKLINPLNYLTVTALLSHLGG